MHYRIRYMYVKYQLNRDNRNRDHKKQLKLHKFVTCNTNFKKSLLSDMHYPTSIFRPNLRPIGVPKIFPQTTDGQTARVTT